MDDRLRSKRRVKELVQRNLPYVRGGVDTMGVLTCSLVCAWVLVYSKGRTSISRERRKSGRDSDEAPASVPAFFFSVCGCSIWTLMRFRMFSEAVRQQHIRRATLFDDRTIMVCDTLARAEVVVNGAKPVQRATFTPTESESQAQAWGLGSFPRCVGPLRASSSKKSSSPLIIRLSRCHRFCALALAPPNKLCQWGTP
jgi:hypothetical protein